MLLKRFKDKAILVAVLSPNRSQSENIPLGRFQHHTDKIIRLPGLSRNVAILLQRFTYAMSSCNGCMRTDSIIAIENLNSPQSSVWNNTATHEPDTWLDSTGLTIKPLVS